MIFLLLFSLSAHAFVRESGSEPAPRPLCRRAEMNSCIESHRAAGQSEISAMASIDDKINILARDRGAIRRESQALESEMRKAQVTAEMAERETREPVDLSSGDPIFSGGPRAEEIFFLKGEPNSWEERHSAERRARLNTLANSSRKSGAALAPIRQNLAMEIEALDALDASLLQERARSVQRVNVHADMCERGCKIAFCRDE